MLGVLTVYQPFVPVSTSFWVGANYLEGSWWLYGFLPQVINQVDDTRIRVHKLGTGPFIGIQVNVIYRAPLKWGSSFSKREVFLGLRAYTSRMLAILDHAQQLTIIPGGYRAQQAYFDKRLCLGLERIGNERRAICYLCTGLCIQCHVFWVSPLGVAQEKNWSISQWQCCDGYAEFLIYSRVTSIEIDLHLQFPNSGCVVKINSWLTRSHSTEKCRWARILNLHQQAFLLPLPKTTMPPLSQPQRSRRPVAIIRLYYLRINRVDCRGWQRDVQRSMGQIYDLHILE